MQHKAQREGERTLLVLPGKWKSFLTQRKRNARVFLVRQEMIFICLVKCNIDALLFGITWLTILAQRLVLIKGSTIRDQ